MTRTFFFAGGGTGGHLFPGLAIAEQLRTLDPASRCIFVCSTRPLDAEILAREDADFRPIPAQPLSLRPRPLLRFLHSWGPSVRAVRALFQSPSLREGAGRRTSDAPHIHLVAMGGFVAAPAVQAARAERIPITLVNLDAVPGKANRWIARHADHIFSAAEADRAWPMIPPIVRARAMCTDSPAACRTSFNLDPAAPTLLVTGASQGAGSINDLMAALARTQPDVFRTGGGWQVIHQTGKGDWSALESAYRDSGVRAHVTPFINDMGRAWRAADLALSRAGAGSVAEAWANRVPTIFLPYPYHRDQHQRRNAEPLARAGAAAIATDRITPDANLPDTGRLIAGLLSDPGRRAAMSAALERLGPADGAAQVARALLESSD